ncbi:MULTISPECIES: hypothetical protein [Shewanella]|nr:MULTISPECIES: hypothetical protein [Shewanella]
MTTQVIDKAGPWMATALILSLALLVQGLTSNPSLALLLLR